MRPMGLLAVAALLAAGSLVTSPAASLAVPACPSPVQEVRDAVQQDDYEAGDAGDCAALARQVVASSDSTYHWATLDHADDGVGLADLHDWFRVDLAAKFGVGGWVMANVSGDVLAYRAQGLPEEPVRIRAPTSPHLRIVMEVLTPVTGALYVVDSCGPGTHFTVEPGEYLVHVTRATGADAVPCVPSAAFPAEAGAPLPVHNYGFYYGCHPHCSVLGAA